MAVMQSPPGAEAVIDGRRYLYFAGTGYLGLQGHAEVIRAACEATERYGIGSATSRAGFGDTPPVLEVERRAAAFLGCQASFYFSSGYVGGHVLVLMLEGAFDAVFVDELSHYCVFEAARLSGRDVFRFGHRDAEALRATLAAKLEPGGRPLVLSDGVFAARGAIAPVAEYREVLQSYPGSTLLIDDAHGLGVLGEHGRGTFEHAGLFELGVNVALGEGDRADSPSLAACGTLSKAIGGYGGIIAGTGPFIGRIKSTSHYYNGASAPPVPVAAATAQALALVDDHPEMRRQLWQNVRLVKSGLRGMGLDVDDTPVPIVCLTLGDAENMRRIQGALAARGVFIAYMAAYSGLGSAGALRLAVFSTHTGAMIGRLLEELGRVV